MQQTAWTIALLLMAVTTVIFLWVITGASAKGSPPASPYRLRGILFWIATIAGLAIAYMTLSPWPLVAHANRLRRPMSSSRSRANSGAGICPRKRFSRGRRWNFKSPAPT